MKIDSKGKYSNFRQRLLATSASAGVAGLLLAGAPHSAMALNLYNGSSAGNAIEINLTTQVSYSTFYRVNDPSAILTNGFGGPSYVNGTGNANGNDGDNSFRHGFVSNEVEAVPVLDFKDGNYGAHLSGEFYLNTAYLGTNQNTAANAPNPISIAKANDFTSATRNIDGENARLLDAFVYGQHTFGNDQVFSLKVGRQTLLWGESLLFYNDGIAAGQAPVDVLTAESLPNPEAQQVFLPVGQVVVTYTSGSSLSIQGYYQFQYQHDVVGGVGSYFNSTDYYDQGGQRGYLAPLTPRGGAYAAVFRIHDNTPPSQNGQFGLAVTDIFGNYNVGLYALRFDSKAPAGYVHLAQVSGLSALAGEPSVGGPYAGNLQIVYPRDIQLYGTSFSTTIGDANVAGEISYRRNMPLVVQSPTLAPGTASNANAGAFYPVGNTLAGQVSAIYVSPGIPFDPGGVSVDGEVELDHVLGVTGGKANLAPGRQATAGAAEIILTPTYYEVLPNFNLTFPIGVTYNYLGNSEMDPTIQHGTGAFTFGVTGTYNTNWIASLTYKDYLGKPIPVFNELADRGYVALNLQHTF